MVGIFAPICRGNLTSQALTATELKHLTRLTVCTQSSAIISTTVLQQLASLTHLDLTGAIAATRDTISALTTLTGLRTLALCNPYTPFHIPKSPTAGVLVKAMELTVVNVRHRLTVLQCEQLHTNHNARALVASG